MTFAEFRKRYPQYGDIPDQELAERLHRRYYSEMRFSEFARLIEYTPPVLGPVAVQKRRWRKGVGLGISCTLLAFITITGVILYRRQPASQLTPVQDVFPVYFTARAGEHQQPAPLIFSPSELLRPPLIATDDYSPPGPAPEGEAAQAGITTQQSPSRPAAAEAPQAESHILKDPHPGETKEPKVSAPVSGEEASSKTVSQRERQATSKPAAQSQEIRAADVAGGKDSTAGAPAQEPALRSPLIAAGDSTPPGAQSEGDAAQAGTTIRQRPSRPAVAEVLQAESRIASDPAVRQPATVSQATRATELPSPHPRTGMAEEAPGTHAAANPALATAGPANPTREATPPEAGDSLFPRPGKLIAAVPAAASGRPTAEITPDRLVVRLEGPRPWVTERDVETVRGTISGGPPVRLALYVNGSTSEVVASGGFLQANVSLQPGLNRIRVVVTDWRGAESQDTITVEQIPPKVPNGIAITNPPDGHTLGPEDPPVIQVEGQVEDWNTHTVWLIANGRRTALPARHGRFRKALPVLDRVVELRAEVPRDAGPPRRSHAVTIRTAPPSPSVGFLLLEWPKGMVGHRVEVSATWRARPERFDLPVEQVALTAFEAPAHDTPSEVFAIRSLKPGVYTFVIEAHDVWASDVRPTLYLPQAGQANARDLKSFSLMGRGKVVLARVLLPQGVLWEQNEWFTGQSISADTTTKFRLPEGIVWKEREGNAE